MNGEIKKLPLYKNAADVYAALGHGPGYVITDEWLDNELELSFISESREEHERNQLDNLDRYRFRNHLMRKHGIYLERVPGVGWRHLPVAEVVPAVVGDYRSALRMANKKATHRLKYAPVEQMTDDQRVELAEAVARASRLRRMTAETFKMPPVPRLGT